MYCDNIKYPSSAIQEWPGIFTDLICYFPLSSWKLKLFYGSTKSSSISCCHQSFFVWINASLGLWFPVQAIEYDSNFWSYGLFKFYNRIEKKSLEKTVGKTSRLVLRKTMSDSKGSPMSIRAVENRKNREKGCKNKFFK